MVRQTELVSQWQEQLSAAEELADGTPRFRWLHAARVRLYRFLLRCYGSGQWRSAVNDEVDPLDVEPAAPPVAVQDEPTRWHGKPAKTAGKIQAVLKSVHNAQDREPQRGPLLAGGIDGSAYVTVTSSGAKVDARKCKEFLRCHGIEARAIIRGRERIVEVPYADLQTASALVDANREHLRLVRPRLTLKTTFAAVRHKATVPTETQLTVVSILLLLPLFGFCLAVGADTILEGSTYDGVPYSFEPLALTAIVLAAGLLLVGVALVGYVLSSRRLPELSAAVRRRCVAIAFACIVAALFIPAGVWLVYESLASSAGTGLSLETHGRFIAAALIAAGAAYHLFMRSMSRRDATDLPAN
jgi:hypothetical protein